MQVASEFLGAVILPTLRRPSLPALMIWTRHLTNTKRQWLTVTNDRNPFGRQFAGHDAARPFPFGRIAIKPKNLLMASKNIVISCLDVKRRFVTILCC